MKKKLIPRRKYEVGKTAWFVHWKNDRPSDIKSGVITKVTNKFCNIDIGGTIFRKAKENIYFDKEDLYFKFLKETDKYVVEKFGITINQLCDIRNELLEKYPEKFI